MKKFLAFILFGAILLGHSPKVIAQSGYTVALTVEDHWWQSHENWGAWLRAVVMYNGTPLPNSTSYYYEWWVNFSHQGFWWIIESGYGADSVVPETRPEWSFRVYVRVTDSNGMFGNIRSGEQEFSFPGQWGQGVLFAALQQNGGEIRTVTGRHWRHTIEQWRNYTGILTQNGFETIHSIPSYVPSLGQKIKYWNGDVSEVLNHIRFHIDPLFGNLHPQYWSTVGNVVVKTDLLDAPGTTGGNIQFRDPWYIDFQDGAYGSNWRNRGMVEPRQFHTRSVGSTGFQPDFTTIYPAQCPYPYNGVFLNENPTWDPTKPNYSVGAPNPNTINGLTSYFANWSGTNVQYQNASAAQTGVVFTNAGATATAKYKAHLASSVAAATGTNSQRKLSVDRGEIDSYAALSYESGGEIWLSESDASLSSFSPEFRVSDGTGNFAFPSVVATSSGGPILPQGKDGSKPTLPHVGVVYQQRFTNGLAVLFREKRERTWRNPVYIENYNFGVVDATPVVGRTGSETFPLLVFVWVRGDGLKSRVAQCCHETNYWWWSGAPAPVPGRHLI